MKLGFITNCFAWAGLNDLEAMADWAIENGFTDLEIGPSIPLDRALFDRVAEKTGIRPSTFIYCRNFLDPKEGEAHLKNLTDRISFAAETGARQVVCTTGITDRIVVDGNVLKYDPESCLEDVVRVFTPLVELAEAQNIRLAFELCPMMFNTAISPYMLERIFEKLDSPYLGLTFDPSHLVWQMIDPYPMVEKFSKKLFHVHGKDCEILWEKLRETGILHTIHRFDHPVDNGEGVKEYDNTWYRYRLPGLGELNWARIISDLQVQGFDGTISIEHEDPVWCGSIEKIQKGLIKSRNYLLKYL